MFQHQHSQLQLYQFVKAQPAPCQLKPVVAFGEMDIMQSIPQRAERIFMADIVGQWVGKIIAHAFQRSFHIRRKHIYGYPLGKMICGTEQTLFIGRDKGR